MLRLAISPDVREPLVEQIVVGICGQIEDRCLRPGTKLPSIRSFAQSHNVSRFTVVEAYDRLVAMGYLLPRPGAGFYTTALRQTRIQEPPAAGRNSNEKLVWLIRRLLDADERTTLVGGPWLPRAWLDEAGIRQTLNALARKDGACLVEYGNPYGYLPLREHLAVQLGDIGVAATSSQIVLTHGGSQAFELIIGHLLVPGDTVLVDDPGYYNLFGNLRLKGVSMVGVPRNADGPDIPSLERLAAEHRPKVFFTQSVMHNPTGSHMSAHVGFKVLQSAQRHGFRIVEDDVYCDLQAKTTPPLAALDQLDRVIYVRSFSKTLSGSLRVGFLACSQALADQIADVKMLTSITSSQFAERLIYLTLVDGHYRKYVGRLQQRLGEARRNVVRALEGIGVELFVEPEAGMFVWARCPGVEDSLALAEHALQEGYMLAPGTVFRPQLQPSPWMRLNVAVCDDPGVQRWLGRIAAAGRRRRSG